MSIAHLAARLRITPNCANYYHWVRLLTEFPQCLSAPGWYRAAITGGFPQPGRLAGIDTHCFLCQLPTSGHTLFRPTINHLCKLMVRLVFRPYTQVRRTICTSVSLRASTRVSSGFALLRHSSPSFGSQQVCSYSNLSQKIMVGRCCSVSFLAPTGFPPADSHTC